MVGIKSANTPIETLFTSITVYSIIFLRILTKEIYFPIDNKFMVLNNIKSWPLKNISKLP